MFRKLSGRAVMVIAALALCACATPNSKRATGVTLPVASGYQGDDAAEIEFSHNQNFKSPRGTPLMGDPLVCRESRAYRVTDGDTSKDSIRIKGGDEISVTSVVRLESGNLYKYCAPFVAFVPEAGGRYIVVNERIGGFSTPMRDLTCRVAVYKQTGDGPVRVAQSNQQKSRCEFRSDD